MSSVSNSLNDIFKKHRLVFWYDPEGEMRDEYDAYAESGVEKVEVKNDEFGLKHRAMREEPDRKFLFYMPYVRPAHVKNWFLDLELSHHVFHADGVSLVLQELGWQEEHRGFVEAHREFFNSKDRKNRLSEKLHSDDGEWEWRLKMLSVICREEPTIEACLLALLAELVEEKDERLQAISKFALDEFFWNAVARQYDYRSENPKVLDFAIEAFLAAVPSAGGANLGQEAKVFIGRWKDSNRYRTVFEGISSRLESDLSIKTRLHDIDGYAELLDSDVFEAIDQKVIVELRNGILGGQTTYEGLRGVIERRETSYWYPKYADVYSALLSAKRLVETIQSLDLSFSAVEEGIERYTQTYWQIDQLYRHFHYHMACSRQATLLDAIRDEVELRYTNDYLLRLGDRFQQAFEQKPEWPPAVDEYQRNFYEKYVAPYTSKGNKVFVIISDALRYEVGEELHRKILRESRFRSELKHQVSVLPSYTQLGMAALLPHEKLEVDPSSGEARADGQRTSGIEARKAILNHRDSRATAVKAQDFLQMNAKEEGRALSRDHDVIYVYQNGIDHVGDKRETEGEVFSAAAKEIDTLIDILKKVASINGSNAIITADHGFLFRHVAPEESDYTETPTGTPMGMVNRRFAFGEKIVAPNGTLRLEAAQVGLDGDYQVALPKSVNRYRKQGSGARYVHGGASLQEVVIPVLAVNKARKDDVGFVDVDVIRSGSNMITTSQARITFYQEQPAVDKLLGQELRIGFYAKTGEALSDVKDISFDSKESEPRRRERKESFAFSKLADRPEYQNSEIILRLEKKIPNSNQFSSYKEFTYRLKKAFESDFEL